MDRLGKWLLVIAIAGSALAVGSVHPATLCVVTSVLGMAAACTWWAPERSGVRSAASILLWAGLALVSFTLLQCVPLPQNVLAAIAPRNADVWSRAFAPLHEQLGGWVTLSVDPIATRLEVLKGVAYLLAFVAALRVAKDPRGSSFLGAALMVTGVALALAALAHPAFGTRKLFGIYEPGPEIMGRHIAPLMNPNNLAGYINIALCIALAGAISPRPRFPRSLTAATALLLTATQLWVASRGGVVAMALGIAVVVVLLKVSVAKQRKQVSLFAVLVGAMTVAGATMVILGGSREASGELFDTNILKVKQLANFAAMLPAYGALGCGRGAFESAFPAFRTDPGYMTWSHPENVIAQWTIEWGIPVGMLGMIAIVFALRPSIVLARSSTAAGAWAGLVALAVQNSSDLGTEVPGLMLGAVVAAAVVVGGTSGRQPTAALARWWRSHRAVCLASGGCSLAAVAWVIPAIAGELHVEERSLYRAAMDHRTPSSEMHRLARAAMSRHPAEPYFPFAVALRDVREHDDDPMPWLGAVLERARVYGPAHLILARVLARRSPSQARMEYRFAATQAPGVYALAAQEAEPLIHGYYDALEVVPESEVGAKTLALLGSDLCNRLPSTCVLLDRDLLIRSPGASGPFLRAALAAVVDAEAPDDSPWCAADAHAGCVHEALERSERLERLLPESCEGYALHSRALAAGGDMAAALAELDAATERVIDHLTCLEHLATMSRTAGDAERADRALTRIATSGCREDDDCVRNLTWVGNFEEESGNQRRALAMYKRAYERAPGSDELLEKVAGLAARSDLHVEAAEYYERLMQRHPEDPRWLPKLQSEREAAAREAARL